MPDRSAKPDADIPFHEVHVNYAVWAAHPGLLAVEVSKFEFGICLFEI